MKNKGNRTKKMNKDLEMKQLKAKFPLNKFS